MIILDTHIWIWWVHGDTKLNQTAIANLCSCDVECVNRRSESQLMLEETFRSLS